MADGSWRSDRRGDRPDQPVLPQSARRRGHRPLHRHGRRRRQAKRRAAATLLVVITEMLSLEGGTVGPAVNAAPVPSTRGRLCDAFNVAR